MLDCVFCKIVAGEVPSQRVWEDEGHIAFLDAYPVRKGQILVVTREHRESKAFELPDSEYSALFLAAKRVAEKLKMGLGVSRVLQVLEGLGVNHAHLKLFPVIDDEHEGGLVPLGSKAGGLELKEMAEKIREGGEK